MKNIILILRQFAAVFAASIFASVLSAFAGVAVAEKVYGCKLHPVLVDLKGRLDSYEREILSIANDIRRGYRYVNCRSQLVVFENCDKVQIHLNKERENMDSLFGKMTGAQEKRDRLYRQCFGELKTWNLPKKEKGFWDSIFN